MATISLPFSSQQLITLLFMHFNTFTVFSRQFVSAAVVVMERKNKNHIQGASQKGVALIWFCLPYSNNPEFSFVAARVSIN
ncbi:MAG: hypothetical protein V8T45_06935 [Oscillospiraceae bacterium]